MNISRYTYLSIYLLLIIAVTIGLYSCASTGNPSGGPKDETPPKIDIEKSTPNLQSNFTKQQIELYFDEFIKLNNPQSQVIISPPLIYPLQFDQRGKRIYVKFHEKEILKEDVTYSINFSDAIVDFREGNKLENYKFVFGTGDVLDSLKFSGKVIDAFSRQPAKEILVMLYDTLNRDSIPYQDRPYYFAQTNEEGFFSIENMKNDTFKVFALGDVNLNYLYDQDNEIIGFTDSLYIVTDSTQNYLELEVFVNQAKPKLYDVIHEEYGVLKLEFDQSPQHVQYTVSDSSQVLYPQVKEDSLLLWYQRSSLDSFLLYLSEDTIQVNINSLKKQTAGPLSFIESNAKLSSGIMNKDSVIITYNHPIRKVDKSLIKVYKTNDTLQIPYKNIAIDILPNDPFSIFISNQWVEKDTLTMVIDSAAIIDIYNNESDSTALEFKIEQAEKRGIIQFQLENIQDTLDYVVEFRKGDKIVHRSILTLENNTVTLAGLKPGKYTATIIEDLNRNQRWDSGSYLDHKQAEVIRTVDIEELRENWEVEAVVHWNKVINEKSK